MNQTVISPETFRMYIAEAEAAYEAQLSAAVCHRKMGGVCPSTC